MLESHNYHAYLERGKRYTESQRELYVPFTLSYQSHSRVDPDEDRCFGEYWTNRIVVRVKFERHAPKKLIKEALSQVFSTQGHCGHSYDCCGCVTHRAYESNIKHLKRNEWLILQSASVNC